MVNVTIVSRKDTISNWQTSNPVLSNGEVAVVEIPATDSTPAICLIKIGDGTTPFNTLQYMQSPAADVYAWAKASTKPEYDYSEIKNLTTMIVAGNNITATTNDNKVTIATTQNVAKVPGTLPDIGDIEALPVWSSDEGWKRVDADALKATANTIVKRNASGQMVTAAPTANTHATNKKYVDDSVSAKQDKLTAGNGIVIGPDSTNTNTEIKIDDTVVKVGVLPEKLSVVTYDPDEEEFTTLRYAPGVVADAIVKRVSTGTIRAADPIIDSDVTTKKYVDDKAATKQDTLTAGDGIDITDNTIKVDNTVAKVDSSVLSDLVMPIYTGSKSKWETVKATYDNYNSYTLARRNNKGQLVVATPTGGTEAANKAYVDTYVGDKLKAGNITWDKVTSSTSGSVTPIGMAMSDFHSANRLAFSKAAGITIESSTDGGETWVDSAVPDSTKINLVSGLDGYHPTIGLVYPTNYSNAGRTATANDKLRITLDGYTMGVYTSARKLLINVATIGATGCKVLVEGATNADLTTFTELANQSISGWSGWNDITFSSGAKAICFGGTSSVNYRIIRLTFSITSVSGDTYPGFLQIFNLALFGDTYWSSPSYYAKSGHLYSWDYEQNVTFPKQVRTSSIPTADNDLTNKKYVDGLVSDNKIARLTDTSKQYVVPCWRGTQWTQYPLTEASIASYSIVQRTSLGQVRVGTPTEDNMATPKSYVDAAVAAISTGGGSSKKLLRFDGNTTAYFDHVATSAYQYTFHLRGLNAMNDGNVKITAGGTTLFSITPTGLAQGEINVDGTLMFYPASSSSSNTQHYITYSYTASDGTCKSGYLDASTNMRVTFDGTIGAPASGIYCNWVIQEQMSCENWEGLSSDEEVDDTETI